MNSFSLFYNHQALGDTIVLVKDSLEVATHHENHANVTLIYNADKLIGINIFNTLSLVKIKATGLLYCVNSAIVNVIKAIVKEKSGLEIEISDNSYVVGIVTDDSNPYLVDIGNESQVVAHSDTELNIGDYVIVSRPYERLKNGYLVSELYGDKCYISGVAYNATKEDIGKPVYSK